MAVDSMLTAKFAAIVSILAGTLYFANVVLVKERHYDKKYPTVIRQAKKDGDFPDKWERKY